MKMKKRGAAEKITLNETVFTGEVIEPTLVNFFYGKNGAGKSTIARALSGNRGIGWQRGTAEDYDILVYDRDFIGANIADHRELAGVFTVCEENIEAQRRIEELKRALKEKSDAYTAAREAAERLAAERETAPEAFRNVCWEKTKELRSIFTAAVSGKKTKALFAEEILSVTAAEHDPAALEKAAETVFGGDDRKYPLFSKAGRVTYASLPGYELMGRAVLGRGETPFASFIKALNAADWVRAGHSHYAGQTGGKCPYCQQRLPEGFDREIAACFDAQYREDIGALSKFRQVYAAETGNIIDTMEGNLTDTIGGLDTEEYRAKLKNFKDAVTVNLQRIDAKVKEPSEVFSLEDTDLLLLETGAAIDVINRRISERNAVVSDLRNQKAGCRKAVWEHMAYVLRDEITAYRKNADRLSEEIAAQTERMKTLAAEGRAVKNEISELNGRTVNTEAAMESINGILRAAGFTGFYLRGGRAPNTYEIVRKNGASAEKLSEGERSLIAFLYFYHLVRGSLGGTGGEGGAKEKIVVIDDPVSGLDGDSLLIVGSLVRKLAAACCGGDGIGQLFVLTHSERLFKEMTRHMEKRYGDVSFFAVRKRDNVSRVQLCVTPDGLENFSPLREPYETLWDEYREVKTAGTLKNAMGRILEHYFIRLCGYGEEELRETVEKSRELFSDEEYAAAANIVSRSVGGDYTDYGADTAVYRSAFEKIFTAAGQARHYRMMIGTGEEG